MKHVFISLLAIAASVVPSSVEGKTLGCPELPGLFGAYTNYHYVVRSQTGTLRARTAKQFLESIDPSRTLLLAPEVKAFESQADRTFAHILRGRCDSLEEMFDLVVKRYASDLALAKELLGPDYALDEGAKMVIDPEERDWPKNAKTRKALIRRKLHFQIASYQAGGLSLKKAKKQLIRRYELNLKRAKERRERKEAPEVMARAYAAALDPHSTYFSPDDLANFEIAMQLSLEGIGAALRSENGFTIVESIVPGGAAARDERLEPGDKIIAVQQEGDDEPASTIDMDLRDVVKMIRGPKGSKVTLTILREAKKTRTFNLTLTRDTVDLEQQAASIDYETRKVGNRVRTVAVLELPSFYGGGHGEGRSSYEDVRNLLAEASRKKVDGLVLDLSRNSGGLLRDAVRISGLFIDEGAIVATKDSAAKLKVLEDEDPETQFKGPLAVLVSPMSASAAEILAGALKAYRRAVIIGGPDTFGKGTVQAVLPLPAELGAMKITTAMYFLPDGTSTQFNGVEADVRVPSLMGGFDQGEDDLDYALKPQSVKPFLSQTARDGWVRVDPKRVPRLRAASKKRVAKSKGFKEIHRAVKEATRKRKTVTIGEIRAEGKETNDEDEEKNRFDAMHETFTDEAVDILVDTLRSGQAASR